MAIFYDASIINLEKSYGFKVTEKITKPVAILLSKVDAFDLQNKIGKNAIQELLAVDKNIKNDAGPYECRRPPDYSQTGRRRGRADGICWRRPRPAYSFEAFYKN